MDKQNTQLLLIAGIVIAAIVLMQYPGLFSKFVIDDSDFQCKTPILRDVTAENYINGTIYYSNITYTAGQVYYTIDNDTTRYSSIPDPEGTHKISKLVVDVVENNTKISFISCSVIYTKEVNNVTVNVSVPGETEYVNVSVPVYVQQNATSSQICTGLGGTYLNVTCSCPNGNKWYDNSTSKVCGSVTVTREPVLTTWEKYGEKGIIVALALIILYLAYGRKKRR